MKQTRKQRAAQLLARLNEGPSFSVPHRNERWDDAWGGFPAQYKRWAESWVTPEVLALVPELKVTRATEVTGKKKP